MYKTLTNLKGLEFFFSLILDLFSKKSLDFWQKISKKFHRLKKKAVLDIYGVFQGFFFFNFVVLDFWQCFFSQIFSNSFRI